MTGSTAHFPIPKSAPTGIEWPALPAGPDARILATVHQLEQSQWWDAELLRDWQLRQLALLIDHAVNTCPWYRKQLDKLWNKARGRLTPNVWRQIPILDRAALQNHQREIESMAPPAVHGERQEVRTSGSTGRPVVVSTTGVTDSIQRALHLRHHVWQQRDFAAKTARIVVSRGEDTENMRWVPAHPSGPLRHLEIGQPVPEQVAWLQAEDPDYLVTMPSNLAAIAQYCRDKNIRFMGLKQANTLGETLSREKRALCESLLGVPVVDLYSTMEIGVIALECPHRSEHPTYHIMSESVLVEILDDRGRACAPGQAGRVVVTPLHNYATPLIRYEIGDYAELGAPCPCGRGLPVLNQILGRVRNSLVLPSGERQIPVLGQNQFNDIAPITQWQIVQKSLETLQINLVTPRKLTVDEETALGNHILASIGTSFRLDFAYHDLIPRSADGKYEDFLSEVET